MHPVLLRRELTIQTNEITEQIIYEHLAESEKDASNKKILERIAADEKQHHQIWQKITGLATSFSMAGSSYLAAREENNSRALSRGAATGSAYIATIFILILPFFIIERALAALFATLTLAVLIIIFFNFYTATVKGLSFKKKFLEMAGNGLGVAAINFGIGWIIKKYFGL